MVIVRLYISLFLSLIAWGVSAQNFIHVNQLGYYRDSKKIAMLSELDAEAFTIRLATTNQVVYSAPLESSSLWTSSGENVQFADFTQFNTPGRYYLQIGAERSYPFSISDSAVYDTLMLWVNKAFYLWRASTPIEAEFATYKGTSFSREIGHPDTVVYIHRSVANEKRHAETEVSAPKGWYDSGDYSKYVVNGAYSVLFLGLAYESYPEYFRDLDFNIPESGDSIPDILNEMKWEFDWLMNMFDETDGGVYFKLSSLKFAKTIMPIEDEMDRYMIGKSTSSALDFAASMAMASRLYAPFDKYYPGYSAKTLRLARRAYSWAKKFPNIKYVNPKDVSTGEYTDDNFSDEFFLAASELFITTKEKTYYDDMHLVQSFEAPTWQNINSIGLMDLAINIDKLPDFVNKTQIRTKVQGLFDNIYKLYYYSKGKLALKNFEWGSNGMVATNGAVLGLAFKVTGREHYLEAAQAAFDYLLGRNPLDYCFVTCFGSRYPKKIHDRRSQSDDIKSPLPGYLVGGPNLDQPTDCGQTNYPSFIYPARAYLDDVCSYSTNEIAINWNAPLVMLIGEIINSNKGN